MKQAILAAVTATAMGATPALADGDWTGFYAGIGVGNLDVDTNVGLSENDTAYGVHAGYRYDFGNWVVGGEFEYDRTSIDLAPGVEVDRVYRLKGNVGYDTGPALLYVALGGADVDVTGVGKDRGTFIGLGAAYQVSRSAILGVEFLRHKFDNIDGSGVDADANSFNIRASLRF